MVHIIGGGIAGLLLAEELDRQGTAWRLYERAAAFGSEASGKNAGIIRSYEADPIVAWLARESVSYYHAHEPSFDHCGIAFKPWEIDYDSPARKPVTLITGTEGILLEDNGCVRPMEVLTRLASAAYRHGEIVLNAEADVVIEAGSARVVLPVSGMTAPADKVVVACGEGAIAITEKLGRPLRLIPHLRTIYEYANTSHYKGPVQWDEESGSYFRAWDDQIVATAGEQIPVPVRAAGESDDKQADPQSVAVLARQFPFLTSDKLKGWRTCRRLMPLDNRPYCGPDQACENLFWLTGLGGRGMSIAPALARELAGLISRGEASMGLKALYPARIS